MEATGGWGSASTLLKAQHGVGLEDQASLPTGWFSHARTWGLHELKKWQLYYLFLASDVLGHFSAEKKNHD